MAKIENGKGALFNNTRKKQPSHPDYTGNFILTEELAAALYQKAKGTGSDGYKVDLAAWIKQGKSGKFLSVSVSAPFEGERRGGGGRKDDLSDDMPF